MMHTKKNEPGPEGSGLKFNREEDRSNKSTAREDHPEKGSGSHQPAQLLDGDSCGTLRRIIFGCGVKIGTKIASGNARDALHLNQFFGRNAISRPAVERHPINIERHGGGLLCAASAAQIAKKG